MDLSQPQNRFEFTPEQVKLLHSKGGEPVHVSVKENNRVYLVIEEGVLSTLDENYIRQGLAHAAAQATCGDEGEWSVEEIKAAGREMLARNSRRS